MLAVRSLEKTGVALFLKGYSVPSNPAVRRAIADVVTAMSDLRLNSVDAITTAARDAIDGADYAGITLVNADGSVESLAATDPVVTELDELQQELREGPCYDAATDDEVYISEDLAADSRWPNYGPKAAALGVGAQMGIDLHHPGDAKAALNLYSVEPWVFVTALESVEIFASHTSLALGYATASSHFEAALSGRKAIGQALGIVMERYQVNEDKAFQFLVRISQESQVKVREVAADIVAGLNRRNP